MGHGTTIAVALFFFGGCTGGLPVIFETIIELNGPIEQGIIWAAMGGLFAGIFGFALDKFVEIWEQHQEEQGAL